MANQSGEHCIREGRLEAPMTNQSGKHLISEGRLEVPTPHQSGEHRIREGWRESYSAMSECQDLIDLCHTLPPEVLEMI